MFLPLMGLNFYKLHNNVEMKRSHAKGITFSFLSLLLFFQVSIRNEEDAAWFNHRM